MDLSFLEELEKEELRFKKFSLVGTDKVLAAGSLKAGYAVNINAGADLVSKGGVVECTPEACCYHDGTCDFICVGDCYLAGGTPIGGPCDPNPCVGVCCEPGCVDNTTPDGCAMDGGTFQGFGTTCADDPPPCPSPFPPCCPGAFLAFDGSGRKFLTQTATEHNDCCACADDGSGGCQVTTGAGATVYSIDPSTCTETDSGQINCPSFFASGYPRAVPFYSSVCPSPFACVVDSATTAHFTSSNGTGLCGGHVDGGNHMFTWTLSDECTP